MQGAIAEALSTSEVAERIWAVAPNRFCADCGAAQPDWASINLCVVICKRCAGVCGGGALGRGTRGWCVGMTGGLSGWRGCSKDSSQSSSLMKLCLCTKPFPLGLTCILTLQGGDSAFHGMGGDTEAQRGKWLVRGHLASKCIWI